MNLACKFPSFYTLVFVMSEAVRVSKNDQMDVTNGPRRNRRCTDLLLLLVFIGHIGVYVWTSYTGIDGGDPERLVAGQDWQGNFCGVKGQKTKDGFDLEAFPYLAYTLNLTIALDDIVDTFDRTTPAAFSADAAVKLDFMDWLANGNANSLLSTFGKSFIPVCVSACPVLADVSLSGVVGWNGPIEPTLRSYFVGPFRTAVAGTPSLGAPFDFSPLKTTVCPYGPDHCIYNTFIPTVEVLGRFCVPKETVMNGANIASSYMPSKWSNMLGTSFGTMIGDLVVSWPMLLISCGVALVIGLLFVFFLRLCAGCFVWVMILGCFGAMAAGGATALVYTAKCVDGSLTDAAKSIKDNGWSMDGECASGFAIADSDLRFATRIFSYVIMGLSVVYLIVMFFVCNRIRLGIAVNKVAAQFVGQNKLTLLLPLSQVIAATIWLGGWGVIACFTLSQFPEGTQNDTSTTFTTWIEASDNCQGTPYLQSTDYTDPAIPVYTYACQEKRYHFDWRICYQFFVLIWVSEFMVAMGQLALSGSVGVWYFSANTEKGHLGSLPLRTGLYNSIRYHMGTAAFGSFILAFIIWVKWVLTIISKISTGTLGRYRLVRWILMPVFYLISCLQRFLAFLNKNAYVQTALVGTSFCTSAKNAFSLIVRNAARFGVLSGISGLVNLFGRMFITAATAGIGWVMITYWYENKIHSPILPIIAIIIIGYVIGGLIMNVFTVAVSSVLQCFLIDEEVHSEAGGAKFTPTQLEAYLQSQKQ